MSEQFKVGEIAIFQNAEFDPSFNERECEVIEGLFLRRRVRGDGSFIGIEHAYLVRFPGYRSPTGFDVCAKPHQLRKKRPPQQYSGELRIRELFDQSPVEQLVPAEIA